MPSIDELMQGKAPGEMKRPTIYAAPVTLAKGFDLIAEPYLAEDTIIVRAGGLLFILNLNTGDAKSMEDMTEFARGFLKFKVPEFEK